jgi:hypothetical protein
MLTRQERRDALALVREDDTDGDPFGTCMMHWFGIANTLEGYAGETPADWQYRPGLFVNDSLSEEYPDSYYAEEVRDSRLTIEQLTYAGNVLARWSQLLKHAGKDY